MNNPPPPSKSGSSAAADRCSCLLKEKRNYPALGAGLTYSYQRFVFQVPLYYNPKTASTNGNWQIGCGLGIKLSK